MKKVGVFYHPAFTTQGYLTLRPRLLDFPGTLDAVLQRPNVRLFECPRASFGEPCYIIEIITKLCLGIRHD
jgi:hypothetical protein